MKSQDALLQDQSYGKMVKYISSSYHFRHFDSSDPRSQCKGRTIYTHNPNILEREARNNTPTRKTAPRLPHVRVRQIKTAQAALFLSTSHHKLCSIACVARRVCSETVDGVNETALYGAANRERNFTSSGVLPRMMQIGVPTTG